MPEPAVSRVRIAVTAALGLAAAFVVATAVLPARRSLEHTSAALEVQERTNVAVEARTADLHAEADELETDPWANRRILRDEFHVPDEGEVLVR